MDIDQRAAFVFDRHPRLLQIQVEKNGHTTLWYGTGLLTPYVVVDDNSFAAAPASMWFTDAVDLSDAGDSPNAYVRAMVEDLTEFREAALADEEMELPEVWHRTMVPESTE